MRVLVLGGTYFIGPHVVRILHSQGRDRRCGPEHCTAGLARHGISLEEASPRVGDRLAKHPTLNRKPATHLKKHST